MSRFIVVADQLTAAQQDDLTRYCQASGWAVWHWYQAAWLLSGVPEGLGPRAIHERIAGVGTLASANILVIEAGEPSRYWGRSPQGSWGWMSEKWGQPG